MISDYVSFILDQVVGMFSIKKSFFQKYKYPFSWHKISPWEGWFIGSIWQLVGYLLISSSSVAIPAIQCIEHTASLRKATIIASFVTFLAIATCGLLSGYKLCKRIIWWCFRLLVQILYNLISFSSNFSALVENSRIILSVSASSSSSSSSYLCCNVNQLWYFSNKIASNTIECWFVIVSSSKKLL